MPSRYFSFAARGPAGRVRLVVAALYTATVIATSLMVLAVVLFADDPGFIGIWLILVTSPLSMVALYLIDLLGHPPEPFDGILFFAATIGAGLLQAWLLWPPRLKVSGGGG
ncbi:SCO4225 family membrane protein [Spirillospora sp. CA-142024]|uniref:SCO4225 family membrane protein n=1 Tax=Spirillospora sp. CA-142024 TaxID=3240036 RepID=UPI003D923A3A